MKEPCPKCREEGRDTSGDNLHRFPEGNAYCNACGYKENARNNVRDELIKTLAFSKMTVADVTAMELPFGHTPERMVDAKIYMDYGITVEFDTATGSLKRVYYPYFNDAGVVNAYKVRTLPKSFMTTTPSPVRKEYL
jgi:hypothetical protein